MSKSLILSAALAVSTLGYSQNINLEEFGSGPIVSKVKSIPYTPEYFRQEKGAILHAKKDDGLNYLVENSRNSRFAESWAFIPKYDFWINISGINPKDSSVFIDNKLKNYALNLSDSVEIYYTHTKHDYDSDVSFKTDLLEYGEIIRYLPTPEDNYWMLSFGYSNPKSNLVFGIASIDGILKINPDSVTAKYPKRDHFKLNDLSIKMTVQMAEFYKGVPVSEFKDKSKNIDGIIHVDFIPYFKKD